MRAVQRVSGIFRAMHYTPHVDRAFSSVEHIMRDVNYGWLVRYIHANGASFFFIMRYRHMARGLYYGSYAHPRAHLWGSGVILFLLTIITGFRGYVLPFGQMSLWGATVITNLASAVPLVGESVVQWLWGGFAVGNATLNRFFSLHFTLPFIRAARAIAHLVRLHMEGVGSGNPLGSESVDRRPFIYFWVKDAVGIRAMWTAMLAFVFFAPNALGHPDNYTPANAMVTPPHIVPEWYLLPFYAILRSIPHKLGGVVAMVRAILGLMARPWLNTSEVRSTAFRPLYKQAYWLFIVNFLILGWIGGKVVEYPYIQIGQVSTFFYFAFIVVRVPVIGRRESYRMRVKTE